MAKKHLAHSYQATDAPVPSSVNEADDEPVTEENDLRVRARRMSDIDRRAKLAAEQGEAEKYVVTDATPSSGGVYPPSSVVEPFSPDVVAAHTPGEPPPEEGVTDPQTAQVQPEPQPASQTTPAEKT